MNKVLFLRGLPASGKTTYSRKLMSEHPGIWIRVNKDDLRAMMLDPLVYVLDEPLGALDPLVRAELQIELKRIFNILKKTVIMVTHDLSEAAFFGHTLTLLNEGRVVQTGTFEDLIRRPQSPYVTQFITAVKPPAIFKEIL